MLSRVSPARSRSSSSAPTRTSSGCRSTRPSRSSTARAIRSGFRGSTWLKAMNVALWGERVAVIAKNCPEYVEILYGLWWGGLAAVPANAKLHGAELGYVLEHSGAKLCFATPELESDLAAHAPPTLERLIVIGSPAYAALHDDPIAAPSSAGRTTSPGCSTP